MKNPTAERWLEARKNAAAYAAAYAAATSAAYAAYAAAYAAAARASRTSCGETACTHCGRIAWR